MKLFKIRCSALPAAFACPGSVRPAEVVIDPINEAANQGSAAHEVMRQIVEMDPRSLDDIDFVALARRWAADEDELRIQGAVGLQVWKELRGDFPNGQAEVELAQTFDLGDDIVVELTGHVDVLSLATSGSAVSIGDWKFGRVDRNHSAQVRGYMALALATYQQVDEARGLVGWMREREVEPYSMNRDQMWDWLMELKTRVIAWDGVYHPGEQCAYCSRNHSCEALTAMARRDVLILGDPGMAARIETGLQDLTDRELISLRRRGKVLAKLTEGIETVLRRRVEAAPGKVIADGDGRELRIVEQEKRLIDPIRALPVLEERLTEEEIAACTVIRPGRVDDAIAAKTARGGKKAAIEELNEALGAAGALSVEVSEKLTDVRSKG